MARRSAWGQADTGRPGGGDLAEDVHLGDSPPASTHLALVDAVRPLVRARARA